MMKKNPFLAAILVVPTVFIALAGCAGSSAPSTGIGKTGSLARFAIYQNYLYAVSEHNVAVFDIREKYTPARVHSFNANETLETIFLDKANLYLGTQEGMNVYSLENPRTPRFLGAHRHIISCDPVVVADDIAYVTLRQGGRCRRGVNELHVLDVSAPEKPLPIAFYPMTNPGGLGVSGNRLYVLDGIEGLKIFDVTDPANMKALGRTEAFLGYDLIPYNDLLLVMADEGLFIYNAAHLPLKKLSQMDIRW